MCHVVNQLVCQMTTIYKKAEDTKAPILLGAFAFQTSHLWKSRHGVYYFRYRDENGKDRRLSLKTKDRPRATQKLLEWIGGIGERSFMDKQSAKDYNTLMQAMNEAVKERSTPLLPASNRRLYREPIAIEDLNNLSVADLNIKSSRELIVKFPDGTTVETQNIGEVKELLRILNTKPNETQQQPNQEQQKTFPNNFQKPQSPSSLQLGDGQNLGHDYETKNIESFLTEYLGTIKNEGTKTDTAKSVREFCEHSKATNVACIDEVAALAYFQWLELKCENAPATKNKKLSQVRGFIDWLNKLGRRPKFNPLNGLKVKKGMTDSYIRFSHEDIENIFSKESFSSYMTDGRKKKPINSHYAWVVLMCLYTGAQSNEMASLAMSSIDTHRSKTGEEIIFVRVKSTHAKNRHRIREIPLPDKLLSLGLGEYIKQQKLKNSKMLFPDLVENKANGHAHQIGKRFNEYLKKSFPALDEKKRLKSFRHTVNQELLSFNTHAHVMYAILGHDQGVNNVNLENYGGAATMEAKKAALDQLHFNLEYFDA